MNANCVDPIKTIIPKEAINSKTERITASFVDSAPEAIALCFL